MFMQALAKSWDFLQLQKLYFADVNASAKFLCGNALRTKGSIPVAITVAFGRQFVHIHNNNHSRQSA